MLAGLGSSGIVLVAEDDPDFGPTLAQLINRNGYRCELVHLPGPYRRRG